MIINIKFVYAKYIEKYSIKYNSPIAEPIIIIESDDLIKIDEFENLSTKKFDFKIKNYDDTNINSIEIYYQFEIIGIDENIKYYFKNEDDDEIINFSNGRSNFFKFGLEREEINYSLIIYFENSIFTNNTNIDIKINTKFKEEN